MGATILVGFLVLCIPVASSRMLPLFSNLKYWYPGNVDYGGLFSDQDVFQAVNISSTGVEDNTTCVLRMSTALTLNPGHQVREPYEGSVEGTANNYYFYDQRGFLSYLEKMYGFPISSTTTDTFRGIPGIMFINVTGTIRSDDVCSILLWDGAGFHQGKGYLHHYAIEKVFLWPAPSGGCDINLNVKQSCFPSTSKVELKSGKKIAMNKLEIGDLVKTYSNDGEIVFSPVITFLDQDIDYKGHYYTISTACGFKITLSEAHLIFKITQAPDAIKSDFAHSSLVRPGDHIAVHSRYGRFHEQVTSVSVAERQGAFAPVTEEGTMLVDNVWVSCYADIADHDLAHTLMTPLKRLYSLAPHVLGSKGKYVHGYLRGALRPIGVRIFGEEKFYQSPKNKALVEYTDLFIESLPIDKNNK
ncbi:desert hedgehog protein-like [Acropora millepora]|uniref:desert hedgehog protein-like n=1 Tax=Acropora millepora TaxID=45264 RepID=UPI001CF35F31|nr:desert hedgehog protein-like [Acropora millepora]